MRMSFKYWAVGVGWGGGCGVGGGGVDCVCCIFKVWKHAHERVMNGIQEANALV